MDFGNAASLLNVSEVEDDNLLFHFIQGQVQVFVNFRGDELRYSFVSHLVHGLERHGIKFFIDESELRGTDLDHIFVRIKESRIALVIFSNRYAESSFCLEELSQIKKLADAKLLVPVPIFYKVDVDDVRKPTHDTEFGRNFWKLAEDSQGEQIKNWKEALECICNKMGLSLGHKRSEAAFVEEVAMQVKRVIAEINHPQTKKRNAGYALFLRNCKANRS